MFARQRDKEWAQNVCLENRKWIRTMNLTTLTTLISVTLLKIWFVYNVG